MPTPTELAVQKLAWELESRKAVEVRLRTETTTADAALQQRQVGDHILEHYIETATGQRYKETQMCKGDAVVGRFLDLGAEGRFVHIDFDSQNSQVQRQVYITRQYWMEDRSDRKQLPQPLLYLYVGREPLHKALPKATHLGTEKVLRRECDRFLFTGVRWQVPQDQVFTLDRQTGIPLKVEGFGNATAREKQQPMWTWTAESLDQVQGHYAPLKSTQVSCKPDGSPFMTTTFQVTSLEFNKEYPPSTFQAKIEAGVPVIDMIKKKITGPPAAKTLTSPGPTTTTSTSPPIEAVPPRSALPVVSGVSLALGAAVLLAAGALWWRRH